jgi:hypothetical protein
MDSLTDRLTCKLLVTQFQVYQAPPINTTLSRKLTKLLNLKGFKILSMAINAEILDLARIVIPVVVGSSPISHPKEF